MSAPCLVKVSKEKLMSGLNTVLRPNGLPAKPRFPFNALALNVKRDSMTLSHE
ncbi:hypothetical protein MD535_22260 [Vibrio sp. ZSDZ65]|uniref:Uncharacterized protein n=1 Tax=Vibrio qingdaonensis TaxID=2829491 RepID=A0A9X3CS02_9VIBR|nr:hypothetical protein [Vibrio qingdaonensis]MCW8348716.1 hypothetical protein [Vibrio qingdaonensis]